MSGRGAPVGNQNAARAKVWRSAIERALDKKYAGDRARALEELAQELLKLCYAGDLGALQELGNRLDGKPAQAVQLSGEDGGPVQFQRIEIVGVQPEDNS